MKNIPTSVIEQAYTYESYRTLIDTLFAENKTTGTDHSPAMLNYTKLNLSRMNRLDKRSRLTDSTLETLAKINRPVIWLVLTEGWFGDAAQIVVLDATTLEVLTTWGPRPAEMQKMVLDAKAVSLATTDKAERKAIAEASANNLHLWYAKDKTETIQVEFLAALAPKQSAVAVS